MLTVPSSATTCLIGGRFIVRTRLKFVRWSIILSNVIKTCDKNAVCRPCWTWVERVSSRCEVKPVRLLRQPLSERNGHSFSPFFPSSDPPDKRRRWAIVSQKNAGKKFCSFVTWNGDVLEVEMRRTMYLGEVSTLSCFVPKTCTNGDLSHFSWKSDVLSNEKVFTSLDARACAD